MRVLVTGGSGYIGGHVVRALREAGCQPLILDRRWTLSEGPGVAADMLDPEQLSRAVTWAAPQGIIHLAARSSVAESVARPDLYRENAQMCWNLASCAGGASIVLASSAAVYGEGGPGQIAESRRPSPANPYGASKLDSEAVLPGAMALRFFNVAGGRGDGGEHLVPKVLQACATGEPFVQFGDGSTVRDFVHVEDVARACVSALLALRVGARPEVLNICRGQGHSMDEVISACVRTGGHTLLVTRQPTRAGDVGRLVGDPRRALEAIGWVAHHGLDEIIGSTWQGLALAAAA